MKPFFNQYFENFYKFSQKNRYCLLKVTAEITNCCHLCMLVLRIIAALSPKVSSENSLCWKAFWNDLPAVKGINHQSTFWQYLESVFILVKSILSYTGSTHFDRFPFHTNCQELLPRSWRRAERQKLEAAVGRQAEQVRCRKWLYLHDAA